MVKKSNWILMLGLLAAGWLHAADNADNEAALRQAIVAGDVIVLIGRGPLGCGMEETYQITSALKYLSFGKEVALVTDARFSGVSTGACIGHVGP